MMMTSIGFTGSRSDATPEQCEWIHWELDYIKDTHSDELLFHHGSCMGKDQAAHFIALSLGFIVVVHPPLDRSFEAHCVGQECRERLPYKMRNQAIANICDILLAVPDFPEEHSLSTRSGTWMTIRMARKAVHKPEIKVWTR